MKLNQIFSYMPEMKPLLLDGSKRRTIRAIGKNNFRDRCNVNDLMYNWIDQRNRHKAKEFLFNSRVVEKIHINIDDAPESEDLARRLESPKAGETWEEFALKDGFDFYSDFLSFFKGHVKKTNKFICFIFTTDLSKPYKIKGNMLITDFIEVIA